MLTIFYFTTCDCGHVICRIFCTETIRRLTLIIEEKNVFVFLTKYTYLNKIINWIPRYVSPSL